MLRSRSVMVGFLFILFLNLTHSPLALADESILAGPDSSHARTYYLKGHVVTANRYEQQPFMVSQPIIVFSAAMIQNQSPAIIPDLFRDAPGLETNDAGPFRTRPVIRGMFGSRVLILVDGERLNNTRESTFSGADLSLVDIGQVERVETVYGPGSVLYGSDALGGVINIITKTPRFLTTANMFKPYGSLQLRYSTIDEQKKGRLEFGGNYKKFSFLAGGDLRKASDYKSPKGTVVNSALGEDNSLDLTTNYQLTDKHRLSLDFQRSRAKDIGYPGTPDLPNFPAKFTFPRHDRDNIAFKWEGSNLTPHLTKISAKLYYQKVYKVFDSEMTIPAGPGMTLYSFSRTLTDVKTFGVDFQHLFLTTKEQHLTWGVDCYREMIDGSREANTRMQISGGPVLFDDTTRNSTVPENHLDAVGVYVNDQLQLVDALVLTLGIRYDRFHTKTKKTSDYVDTRLDPPEPYPSESRSLGSFNGGLGAVYSLSPNVNLVANLASGYRAPNAVETYFSGQASGSEFVIPNYDLEPERSYNLDVGTKLNFEKFYASLTLFQNNFRDYIDLESTGDTVQGLDVWHYTNITKLKISGVEGVLNGDLGQGVYGSFSFAYNYGQNLTTDQPFFVAPLKTVFTLGWKNRTQRFGAESSARWVQKQDRVPKDPEGKYRDNLPTESFTVANLEAFLKLFEWQTLNLSVNNIFDEAYAEPYNATNPDNPVKEPGRNFIFSLTTRF
jgi:hemoglobin/transferrin/lactoferrin receptor protein